MYIPCEASSGTLLHQNRKLSSRISLQNQLFCLCRLPAVNIIMTNIIQLTPQVDKSGCFPTQMAVIVLLYFCQCFIGYLLCGGKLGCSAGNNRVVRRGTIGLFPGSANFGKTSQLFYYHMTNLIQSKSII